jgi:hypothetical protein
MKIYDKPMWMCECSFSPLRKSHDTCEFCGRAWERVLKDKYHREQEEILKKATSMMKGEATKEDRKGVWDYLKAMYERQYKS